ncbi:Integrase family protein [uncultured Paludibacter sp.]|uniref:Integrase family protein n=1 Tax=uncultured Paludibacter sp. TaxID=497635 RepID=A0A653AJE5_9BACT|nr:Integrase family protein [uncultured Paludibacter sp.]
MAIKFYLKNPKEKETAIYARFSYGTPQKVNGKLKYDYLKYYISKSINPEFWNTRTSKARETNKFPQHPEFNERLRMISNDIESVLLQFENAGITPTKKQLKTALDKLIKPDKTPIESNEIDIKRLGFVDYLQHLIDTATLKNSTIRAYKVVKNNLIEYQDKNNVYLTFQNVDIDFYNSFLKFLEHKNFGVNTIGARIKVVKTVLNNANDRGIDVCQDYKKKSFKKVTEESENVYLSESELDEIYNLKDLPNYLDKVRDLFLIGCYTGLRFSDLTRLKKDFITIDNTISIKTQKTGKNVEIPIHSRVSEILKKYNYELPKPISNQNFNEYIKEVAKLADFDEKITKQYTRGGKLVNQTTEKYNLISSHTARRSFATNAFLADVPTLAIMQITGHKTESAFMKYIKMSAKDNAIKLKSHKFFNHLSIAK